MYPKDQPQRADVIFFLGAGASVHAGVPALGQMTAAFREQLKSKEDENLAALYNFLVQKIKEQNESDPNFEEILGLLYQLEELASGDRKPALASVVAFDAELSDKKAFLAPLRLKLEAYIRDQALKPKRDVIVNYLAPLLSSNWLEPIEIFSTNYDICVELLCQALKLKLVDGFDPEWNPSLLRPSEGSKEGQGAIRLYKLHGSALWYRSEEGLLVKSHVRMDPQEPRVSLFDGRKADQLLLYPAFKQPKETPFFDLAQILRERLSQKKFVIVIGYAFGDEYLRHLFRDAFLLNPDIHMILIDPKAMEIYGKLIAEPALRNAFENRVACCPFKTENFLKDFTQNEFDRWADALKAFNELDYQEQTMGQRYWGDLLKPEGSRDQGIDFVLAQRIYEKAYTAIQFPDDSVIYPHPELLYPAAKILALAVALKDEALENAAYTQYKGVMRAIWWHLDLTYNDQTKQISCSNIYEQVFIDPTRQLLEKLVSWSGGNNSRLVSLNQRFIQLERFLKNLGKGMSFVEFIDTMKIHMPQIVQELQSPGFNPSSLKGESEEEYWKRIQPLLKKDLPAIFDLRSEIIRA